MKKRIMALALIGMLAATESVAAAGTAEYAEAGALSVQAKMQPDVQTEMARDVQAETVPITGEDGRTAEAETEAVPEVISATEAVLEEISETETTGAFLEKESVTEKLTETETTAEGVSETEIPEEEIIISPETAPAQEAEEELFTAEAAEETADGVPIDEAHFPDEKLRKYVKFYDEDQDGILSEEENYSIWMIDLSGDEISDLSGIEYLTELQYLECHSNRLRSLDVSKNTKLKRLGCANNQLRNLDVSKNTELLSLDCMNNQLASLDVSKNTELVSLDCMNNQLASLDVSKNTKLESLICDGNQLKNLDVSKNTELVSLDCMNNQLASLDVSKNTELVSLGCINNQLTSLDVSKNTKLESLTCNGNQLKNLDVSKNTELIYLACTGNQLTSLDLSKNTRIVNLFCFDNTYDVTLSSVQGGWRLDLAKIVGAENVGKVTVTSEITGMKREGNILSFTGSAPETLAYTYDTGCKSGLLEVTLTLNKEVCAVHKFGDYVTTTEPTVTTPGVATRTCTVCGTTETKELPKLKGTIKLSSSTLTVPVKQTVSAKALVGGMQKGDAIKKWQSANTKIATVDKNGNITGIAAGKVKIRVKLKSGASAILKVTVQGCSHSFGAYVTTTEPTVLKAGVATRTCSICGATETKEIPKLKGTVKLSTSTLTVQANQTVSVKSLVGGMQKGDAIKNWKSANTKIAAVDKNGNITGVATGKVKIRVKLKSGASAILKVTVQKGTVATEAIQGLNKKLVVASGKTVTLKPQLKPVSSTQKITYRSSDNKIVTVDANGVVKGVKAGTAKIQVKSGNAKFIIKVKVTK